VLDPARDDHASVQVGEPPDGSSGMNDAPPPPSPPAPAPAPTRPRLEFLDAVRGIAAFTVAVQHSLDFNYPSYVRWSHEVFRPGEWGVVLFFISSGFIVPVSLERYNSVGRFWIGRFFRLYPLYWAVSAAALVLFAFDRYALGGDYTLHWVRATAANLTMAQEFIGQPHVLGQAWTLSYELVFYGVVSVLFLLGLHKSPGWFVLAGLSGALLLGGVIPLRMVTGGTPGDREVVVLTAVLAAGLAVWLLRGSWRSGVLAAGMLLAVVPLVANRNHPAWFSLLLFSAMFVGWVLHRWFAGQLSGRQTAAIVVTALVAVPVVHYVHFQVNIEPSTGAHTDWFAETLTFLGAYAAFLGFLALRRHHFPWVLRWLGQISYSVYLVHGVVIQACPRVGGRATTVIVWLAATLLVSALTYRYIERPCQQVGRRVAVWAGRDRATRPAPSAPEAVGVGS
jgi:peptidoglycan/LPS O-acetylase OafA/YrhL